MKQFCMLDYKDSEVSIPLFDERVHGKGPSVSIVIGPNGSGKSRMLSRVVDELCYLHAQRSEDKSLRARFRPGPERATIKYRSNDVDCEIVRGGGTLRCTAGGTETSLSAIPFPKRVATVSHLATDKFRFSRNESSDFYRYLGLRQATNLTTTGALEAKVMQSLFIGFTQEGFTERLHTWLSLAGMTQDVGVAITLLNEDLLTCNRHGFETIALKAAHRKVGAARVSAFESSEAWPRDLDNMWRLFLKLRDLFWSEDGKFPSVTIVLKELLSVSSDARSLIDGFEAARRWKLFREASLILSKPGGRFRFSDLSSGEQQLIGTNARLLAELESNSLVVIDEPEISLHPDWQIKYVPTLLKSLNAIPATHVIIATHSHFMVADLDSENSALITSTYDGGPKFRLFDGEVYGRSPENILYRVFGVATAGNSNVEGDLHSALRMLSRADPINLVELRAIYLRLEKVRGKDNDAMNVILDKVRGALEGVV